MLNYYEKEDFGRTVFCVDYDKEEIRSDKLSYLYRQYAEETTTPRGVDTVFHVRGTDLWSWGTVGNHPFLVESFDNEEAAEHALLLSFKYDMNNNDNAPDCYNTLEEAQKALNKYLEEAHNED